MHRVTEFMVQTTQLKCFLIIYCRWCCLLQLSVKTWAQCLSLSLCFCQQNSSQFTVWIYIKLQSKLISAGCIWDLMIQLSGPQCGWNLEGEVMREIYHSSDRTNTLITEDQTPVHPSISRSILLSFLNKMISKLLPPEAKTLPNTEWALHPFPTLERPTKMFLFNERCVLFQISTRLSQQHHHLNKNKTSV